MTRDRILVVGANGTLGRAILRELGPERAIAAVRAGAPSPSGFEQVTLAIDGEPPAAALRRANAVINAAGRVTGEAEELSAANVVLPLKLAQFARAGGVSKFVQVSSFAVFGNAETIDASAEERPINDYGRSKAECDGQLLPLAADGFAVECLRLPFMFSAEKPALMSPLLAVATRLRSLPVASKKPFARSMITYRDAALQLLGCARTGSSGTSHAADPRTFDYRLLQAILAEEAGMRIRLLPMPSMAVSAVNRLLPAVGRRLFRSNVLAPAMNSAGSEPLGLDSELRRLVRSCYARPALD